MRTLIAAFAAAALIVPATVPADAKPRKSSAHRHYYKKKPVCRRSKAEAGGVVGGVGGAVAGAALGGGILGTVAGGVGGVVAGKAVDRTLTAKRRCR